MCFPSHHQIWFHMQERVYLTEGGAINPHPDNIAPQYRPKLSVKRNSVGRRPIYSSISSSLPNIIVLTTKFLQSYLSNITPIPALPITPPISKAVENIPAWAWVYHSWNIINTIIISQCLSPIFQYINGYQPLPNISVVINPYPISQWLLTLTQYINGY